MFKLLKHHIVDPGDRQNVEKERLLDQVEFNVIKFNNRRKPDFGNQVLHLSCFSEFGCETVGCCYPIPRILKTNPGKYSIAMGWWGRSYLYRHLVDEFWELKEEYQWLREYARAFHHKSQNLRSLEKKVAEKGILVSAAQMGKLCQTAHCEKCKKSFGSSRGVEKCPFCASSYVIDSIYGNTDFWKDHKVRLPLPSQDKIFSTKKLLKSNDVAIFARGRRCYGRNLNSEFYVKLINYLRNSGYNPIWLGEKQSVLPCPVEDVLDFSRMPESSDLETTLAIISQCKFTIQFWTASTRLAGMMGVPYILFESPGQVWNYGQEEIRRRLSDIGNSKLIPADFINVVENQDAALRAISRSICEMEQGDFKDVFESELLADVEGAIRMKKDKYYTHKWTM